MTSLTDDQVPALLARLRSGEVAARNEAVLGYVGLAMAIVGRYIAVLKSDRLADDMVSSALTGIAEAISRVVEGKLEHDNLKGYVAAAIHWRISEAIRSQQIVSVPHQTVSKRRRAGKDAPPKPERVELNDPAVVRKLNRPSGERDVEISEILGLICQNDLEKSILQLRLEGLTDQEIADRLEASKTTVFVNRKSLEQRFLELFYGD